MQSGFLSCLMNPPLSLSRSPSELCCALPTIHPPFSTGPKTCAHVPPSSPLVALPSPPPLLPHSQRTNIRPPPHPSFLSFSPPAPPLRSLPYRSRSSVAEPCMCVSVPVSSSLFLALLPPSDSDPARPQPAGPPSETPSCSRSNSDTPAPGPRAPPPAPPPAAAATDGCPASTLTVGGSRRRPRRPPPAPPAGPPAGRRRPLVERRAGADRQGPGRPRYPRHRPAGCGAECVRRARRLPRSARLPSVGRGDMREHGGRSKARSC